MSRLSVVVLGGVVAGLAGCTLAPKYVQPAAPVPARWGTGERPVRNEGAAALPSADELGWREFITDSKLQKVVALALENNRDLRLATLNVERARAVYGIQRAALLPNLTAVGGGAKQRASSDLTEPGKPQVTENYSVQGGVLSWEADLFGRVRSLKDRALEQYLATRHARRGAQTLLVSEVARAYLSVAADRDGLRLATNTVLAQQKAYDLVERQYQAGVATELDLRQARIPLEAARTSVAVYTRQTAQDENALCFLVGTRVPPELTPTTLDEVGAFPAVASGVPSDVLLRRPDVLQAEAVLKAANADLGAARAAFFPSISLTSTVGTASNELSRLFEPGTRTWSFAPTASLPVLDARIWAAHRASKVQFEMTTVQYEQAIQNAFREVADALAIRASIDQQLAAQQSLVDALSVAQRLATARFERGVESYLAVLDAQASLFASQQELVRVRFAKINSEVQLYAVLGGGGDDTAAEGVTAAAHGSRPAGRG